MEFCRFVERLEKDVEKMCGEMGAVEIRKIPGNNGTMHTAMDIMAEGGKVSPVIYLSPYYKDYREGRMSIENAAKEICTIFKTHEMPSFVNTAFDDFGSIRDKIIYQLVDYGRNRQELQDIPYIGYCDLAVVFCLMLENDGNGRATAMIHKEHMEMWNVDMSTLYELAGINTPRLLPAEIKSMAEVMKEFAREQMGNEWGNALFEEFADELKLKTQYILTNSDGVKGAAAILYEGVLKTFADKIGSDLFILPSSVHEVILVPYEESINAAELGGMVKNINRTEVPKEDVLSDHVYLYSRETDQVTLVFGEPDEAEGI